MKVAVIIPVYNAERFLARCLDSVCSAARRAGDAGCRMEAQVICIDDGSTDASPSILKDYIRSPAPAPNSRFQVLHQSNLGVSAARNAGLDCALSDPSVTHIMFLDADDAYTGNCLAEVARAVDDHPSALIEWDFDTVDEQGNLLRSNRSCGCNIWCRCYPRSAVEDVRFFTGTNVAEDIAFNLEVEYRHRPEVRSIRLPLLRYSVNTASEMRRRLGAADFGCRIDLLRYLADFASSGERLDLAYQFYKDLSRLAAGEADAGVERFSSGLKELHEHGLLGFAGLRRLRRYLRLRRLWRC